MATTTNYGWTTPDDTALVKDGAAAIRSLGTAIDTTVFNNASAAIAKTIVDAKGDIIVATAADTVARLAVGANDQVLIADSTTATGLKWGTATSAAKIGQVVFATTDTLVANSTTTYADSGLTATITPTSATSKILILLTCDIEKSSGNAANAVWLKLVRNGTDIEAFGQNLLYTGTALRLHGSQSAFNYRDAPASTSALTYKVQFKNATAAAEVDFSNGGFSSIVLMEVLA